MIGKAVITKTFAIIPFYGSSNKIEGPSKRDATVNPRNEIINCKRRELPSNVYGNRNAASK